MGPLKIGSFEIGSHSCGVASAGQKNRAFGPSLSRPGLIFVRIPDSSGPLPPDTSGFGMVPRCAKDDVLEIALEPSRTPPPALQTREPQLHIQVANARNWVLGFGEAF